MRILSSFFSGVLKYYFGVWILGNMCVCVCMCVCMCVCVNITKLYREQYHAVIFGYTWIPDTHWKLAFCKRKEIWYIINWGAHCNLQNQTNPNKLLKLLYRNFARWTIELLCFHARLCTCFSTSCTFTLMFHKRHGSANHQQLNKKTNNTESILCHDIIMRCRSHVTHIPLTVTAPAALPNSVPEMPNNWSRRRSRASEMSNNFPVRYLMV